MYTADKFKEEFNIRTKNKQTAATIQLKGSKAISCNDSTERQ